MIQRGKYQSLTMVNWNGFFARTFDIDALVTTLSGGNGAGKSTTMAAFITSLIPDQTLLHFRNTTEAGSSNSSRDKGLHGKLRPGTCYAVLDVVNSRKQRVMFGVKLQQVAGRDKKVDIKPFLIQGLPAAVKPTEVLVETISDSQARVRQVTELKEVVSKYEGAHFKAFNSVTDYHAQMFEFGVLPKKLRTPADRGKFYRLIEASLYGGISSAITKSLRDYLLPQNGGVKKAFQDMESALRENRATLDAIKVTQRDRDLFKHLITEATNYVASDYMRHANDRRQKLEQTLKLRGELMATRTQISTSQDTILRLSEEKEALDDQHSMLEQDTQAASDHLQLVQTALRQQEKITRYEEDLEELNIRLEEQIMVVEEAAEQLAMAEEQSLLSEDEVDSLKTQLADYQQALDIQQTRALQYQQAVTALEKAQEVSGNESLSAENAHDVLTTLKADEETLTNTLLALKHKVDMVSAAAKQFDRGLALVEQIAGTVARTDLAAKAREILVEGRSKAQLVERGEQMRAQFRDLERGVRQLRQAREFSESYLKKFNVAVRDEMSLEQEQARLEETLEQSQMTLEHHHENGRDLKQKSSVVEGKIRELEARAPGWIAANDALEKLVEQSGRAMADSQAVMEAMQETLDKEREASNSRDQLASRKEKLEKEIERLAQPGGSNDARLQSLADTLGGTLLSEIYDDITLDDAPYFSALYGPARHAIVVPDLRGVKEKLVNLDDCPDDLYIIEGEADGFDDSVFDVEELEGAVCVHLNDRQLRYSRFPKVPLFGRAAREHRLELLRDEREDVVEGHAKAAFDSQKLQRLYHSFNHFVANHLSVAFDADPEQALKVAREERNQINRALTDSQDQENQIRSRFTAAKEAIALLGKLSPVVGTLEDETLEARFEEVEAQLNVLDEARFFMNQHGKALAELETLVSHLDADPEQFEVMQAAYQEADEALQAHKRVLFAVADLAERRHHFGYADAVALLSKSSELNEQLKTKLAEAERNRARSRDSLKQLQGQVNQYNQVLASLKSSHQAKQETLAEFRRELADFGVRADADAEERARQRREDLHNQLMQVRARISELAKSLTALELELKGALKSVRKVGKDYVELRKFVVNAKAGWCQVLKLARDAGVEKQLNRREMAYMSAQELRSLSDKSLGALRLAVADNDDLRDALRQSEDNAHPERKVLFYIAVYQHLRQRIRQDIIRTDDPIEAIEEMEVELARLTEELTAREKQLAISSESVANIIRKTIQREQNRIRLLNQGLQNINFGQVAGVRLRVNVRESHSQLLAGLAENAHMHQDLFGNNRLSFSEAMAKLFQRLNPHIDIGQRTPQLFGEELLDYRNYLELGIEVNRGTDGWLQAESGALSTGEAIGTGQAILLMVVQSWEEESRRLRGKGVIPCRLLFLDEAARLDAKSIATLFELCDRLDMQLLIAAPENISPEQGTTYKLVRKIFNDREHVHVVGLRGFANQPKIASITEEPVQEAS